MDMLELLYNHMCMTDKSLLQRPKGALHLVHSEDCTLCRSQIEIVLVVLVYYLPNLGNLRK